MEPSLPQTLPPCPPGGRYDAPNLPSRRATSPVATRQISQLGAPSSYSSTSLPPLHLGCTKIGVHRRALSRPGVPGAHVLPRAQTSSPYLPLSKLPPMGQQQLLLLVLATVIVGIATVVGIQAFSENSSKSNADAMMQDAVRVASDLQAWKLKPAPFGGQGQSQGDAVVADPADFTGATLAALGYESTNNKYTNLNGTFGLVAGKSTTVITGDSQDGNQQVTVAVCGPNDSDIKGTVVKLGGSTVGSAASCATADPTE